MQRLIIFFLATLLCAPVRGGAAASGDPRLAGAPPQAAAKVGRLGEPGSGSTLPAAVAALGGKVAVLQVPPGTWPVDDNLTIPDNLTLQMEPGAMLSLAAGKTLTLSRLAAGRRPIFTGPGRVAGLQTAYPEWWGTGAGADDRPILAAINSLDSRSGTGRVILSGDYTLRPGRTLFLKGRSRLGLVGPGTFNLPGDYGYANVFVLDGCTDIAFKKINFHFQGPAPDDFNRGPYCIRAQNHCRELRVQDCSWQRAACGVFVENSADVRIEGNRADTCYYAVYLSGGDDGKGVSTNLHVQDNYAINSPKTPFGCDYGCRYVYFVNNTAINSRDMAFASAEGWHYAANPSDQVYFIGNTCAGSSTTKLALKIVGAQGNIFCQGNNFAWDIQAFAGNLSVTGGRARIIGAAHSRGYAKGPDTDPGRIRIQGVTCGSIQVASCRGDISIEGARVDGAGLGQTYGIRAEGRKGESLINVLIADNTVKNVKAGGAGFGIEVDCCAAAAVRHNTVTDCDNGLGVGQVYGQVGRLRDEENIYRGLSGFPRLGGATGSRGREAQAP